MNNAENPAPTVQPAGMFDGAKEVGGAGWIRIGMLQPGDILLIETERTTYSFFITGDGHAVVSDAAGGGREIVLLGSSSEGGVNWGSIQCGGGLLFREIKEEGTATQTSPVKNIKIRAKRIGSGTIGATASGTNRPAPVMGVGRQPVTASVNPRVAIPRPRV